MNEFNEDEVEALRKVAKERIAYDTIQNKLKTHWIWIIGAGALSLWALWDKLHEFIIGVK